MSETHLDQSGAERREHPRVDTRLELQGSIEAGGTLARMVASNLSLGGLYCTSHQDFAEMTRLAIRLVLPGPAPASADESAAVDVEAVVVRRRELEKRTSDQPRYELALYFTKIDGDGRQRLSDYIQGQR